jgi:pimeloyl-ACP methyl ester carboxylesterase
MASMVEYTELPERAAKALENFLPSEDAVATQTQQFAHVSPRATDKDGNTEMLDNVTFTHHFIATPGDYGLVAWHYVTCGSTNAIPIVFLHGIPDSWFQWHHQMAAFSTTHFCVGVDLKGCGQSTKAPGSYVHEAVAEQLFTLLHTILPAPKVFYLVTHERGTVQADFICAKYPGYVLGYARGEQHLYHFDPGLAPQHQLFMNAPYSGVMANPKEFVLLIYTWMTLKSIPDAEMERVIQEFSYADITRAVPRYFMSSNFQQEWLARRQGGWRQADGKITQHGLLEAWKCPIVMMQGYDSKTQPREFYTKAREYVPNATTVEVRYMSGGHFWTLESPEETEEAIRRLVELVEHSGKPSLYSG